MNHDQDLPLCTSAKHPTRLSTPDFKVVGRVCT